MPPPETRVDRPAAHGGSDVLWSALGGVAFGIVPSDEEMRHWLHAGLADLVSPAPDSPAAVYRFEQVGPAWLAGAWAIRRDGEVVRSSVARRFLLPVVLHDVAERQRPAPGSGLEVGGSVLDVDGGRVLVVSRQHDVPAEMSPWWDERALVTRVMRRGARLVAHGAALLTLESETPKVRAFWRPFQGPVSQADPSLGVETELPVVPASRFGELTEGGPLAAVLVLDPVMAVGRGVEDTGSATTVAELALRMHSDPDRRRSDFRLVGALVETVRSLRLAVGAERLDLAADQLLEWRGV